MDIVPRVGNSETCRLAVGNQTSLAGNRALACRRSAAVIVAKRRRCGVRPGAVYAAGQTSLWL